MIFMIFMIFIPFPLTPSTLLCCSAAEAVPHAPCPGSHIPQLWGWAADLHRAAMETPAGKMNKIGGPI